MSVSSARRLSQETGDVTIACVQQGAMGSRSASVVSGYGLEDLTQNVFRSISKSQEDTPPSGLLLNAKVLSPHVEEVALPTHFVPLVDYSDSEDQAVHVVEDSAQNKEVRLPEPTQSKLASQGIEEWLKAIENAPQPEDKSFALEQDEEGFGDEEKSASCEDTIPHTLTNPQEDIDSRLDALLENNPCSRMTRWLMSFIPSLTSPSKSSMEKAEEDRAAQQKKLYETFITQIEVSNKISREKLKEVKAAKNKDLVLKQAFNTYQALMTKNLRGYEGNGREEKALDRAIQSILNTRLKK
jgi:hypothetical protein